MRKYTNSDVTEYGHCKKIFFFCFPVQVTSNYLRLIFWKI